MNYKKIILVGIIFLILGYSLNESTKDNSKVGMGHEKFVIQIPEYIKSELKSYQIKNIDEKTWKEFLKRYLEKNSKTKLPDYILYDLKEQGINTNSLNEEKWKKFLNLLTKKEKVKDYMKNKLLHLSAKSGRIDIEEVKELLSLGYDINTINEKGETYIQVLVKNLKNVEDVKNIEDLVSLGANLNIESNEDIFKNGYLGKKDIVNYALENIESKVRDKILSYLSKEGMSLESNPEKYIKAAFLDEKYEMPIIENIDMSAKITGDENSFEFLFHKLDADTITKTLENNSNIDYSQEGINLLHKLAFSQNLTSDHYKKILSLDLNVNAQPEISERNSVRLTPLMINMISGNVGISKMLLEKGANPYIEDDRGRNAFFYSNTMIKNSKVMKRILKKYNREK